MYYAVSSSNSSLVSQKKLQSILIGETMFCWAVSTVFLTHHTIHLAISTRRIKYTSKTTIKITTSAPPILSITSATANIWSISDYKTKIFKSISQYRSLAQRQAKLWFLVPYLLLHQCFNFIPQSCLFIDNTCTRNRFDIPLGSILRII